MECLCFDISVMYQIEVSISCLLLLYLTTTDQLRGWSFCPEQSDLTPLNTTAQTGLHSGFHIAVFNSHVIIPLKCIYDLLAVWAHKVSTLQVGLCGHGDLCDFVYSGSDFYMLQHYLVKTKPLNCDEISDIKIDESSVLGDIGLMMSLNIQCFSFVSNVGSSIRDG